MDISVKEALEALRPVALQAKAAIRLAGVLESLVGLDNHRSELEAAVEKLKGQVAEHEGQVEKAVNQAVETSLAGKESARAIIQEAKDRAAVIAAECKISVDETKAWVDDAHAEAEALLADLSAKKALLESEVEDLGKHREALAMEVVALKDRFKTFVE